MFNYWCAPGAPACGDGGQGKCVLMALPWVTPLNAEELKVQVRHTWNQTTEAQGRGGGVRKTIQKMVNKLCALSIYLEDPNTGQKSLLLARYSDYRYSNGGP